MKNLTSIYSLATVCLASLLLWSCGRAEGEFAGSEYMPDMSHSIAYEANHNLYYYNNTWDEGSYDTYAGPRKPADGAVARGYLPFKYQNLEDYRTSADESHVALQEKVRKMIMADPEMVNPIRPTKEEEVKKLLADGAILYGTTCQVCHGVDADGNGTIYNSGDGKYTAAPANFMKDEFINAPDGQYINAIMHGKGMMQSHADKLTPTERWKVVHYIRSLQSAKKGETVYEPWKVNVAPTAVTDTTAVVEEHGDDHSDGGH